MSNWSLMEHTTQYLQRPRLGDRSYPSLWPSEGAAIVVNDYGEEVVVGKCRRATFFRYMVDSYSFSSDYSFYKPLVDEVLEKQIPTDRYTTWIFRAGELYERYCIEIAKEAGIYLDEQVRVYIPSHNIGGYIDLIALDLDSDCKTVVEYKSVYGHNANSVIPKTATKKKLISGSPRESNLIQVGLYHWWYARPRGDFGASRLVYGARDTGRYAEYLIDVDSDNSIVYRQVAPYVAKEVKTKISIESILDQYAYIQKRLDSGVVPERDFELSYSQERIALMYERGELGKVDSERFEKHQDFLNGRRKRSIKPVEKGDWQCRLCQWKNVCYNEAKEPRAI